MLMMWSYRGWSLGENASSYFSWGAKSWGFLAFHVEKSSLVQILCTLWFTHSSIHMHDLVIWDFPSLMLQLPRNCVSICMWNGIYNWAFFYLALFLTHAVPPPAVQFDLTSPDTISTAGETVTLNCKITLMGEVTDSDVVVNSTWTKDRAAFSGVSGRVTLPPQTRVNSTFFITQLVFSPPSSSMDSGTYTCVVTVTPSQPEFAIGTMRSGSINLSARGLLVIFEIHTPPSRQCMTQQSAVNMLGYENTVAKRLAFATVTERERL